MLDSKSAKPLIILLLALFPLYFMTRFMPYLFFRFPMGLEECHTGAVVREIIENGFEFPIEQYTPEYYENTIIIGSLLSIIPVRLFGLSVFSLKSIPFLFSYLCLVIGCLILFRSGFKKGIWFYLFCYFAGPLPFIYQNMDSVGNHIIGLFSSSLNLYLFYLAYTTRKAGYFYGFMFFAGFGVFMHFASVMYTLLCFLVYILFKPGGGDTFTRPGPSYRQMCSGLTLLSIGILPFLLFVVKTKHKVYLSLIANATSQQSSVDGISEYVTMILKTILVQFDMNAVLLFTLIALYAVVCLSYFKDRTLSIESRFLLFITIVFPVVIYTAVLLFSGIQPSRYYTYLYQMLYT